MKLEGIETDMYKMAKEMNSFAYAPYSHFPVSAVVLTDQGALYAGCNVENASYGLTICAERNAVFKAVSENKSLKISKVLIYTPTEKPATPCGACRQVLNEFAVEAEVLCCTDSTVQRYSLGQLLPAAFGPNNLEV